MNLLEKDIDIYQSLYSNIDEHGYIEPASRNFLEKHWKKYKPSIDRLILNKNIELTGKYSSSKTSSSGEGKNNQYRVFECPELIKYKLKDERVIAKRKKRLEFLESKRKEEINKLCLSNRIIAQERINIEKIGGKIISVSDCSGRISTTWNIRRKKFRNTTRCSEIFGLLVGFDLKTSYIQMICSMFHLNLPQVDVYDRIAGSLFYYIEYNVNLFDKKKNRKLTPRDWVKKQFNAYLSTPLSEVKYDPRVRDSFNELFRTMAKIIVREKRKETRDPRTKFVNRLMRKEREVIDEVIGMVLDAGITDTFFTVHDAFNVPAHCWKQVKEICDQSGYIFDVKIPKNNISDTNISNHTTSSNSDSNSTTSNNINNSKQGIQHTMFVTENTDDNKTREDIREWLRKRNMLYDDTPDPPLSDEKKPEIQEKQTNQGVSLPVEISDRDKSRKDAIDWARKNRELIEVEGENIDDMLKRLNSLEEAI